MERYKRKSLKNSLDITESRNLRALNRYNERRKSRSIALSSQRNISEGTENVKKPLKTSEIIKEKSDPQTKRIEMLKKFKEEKLLKKKLEPKKPLFKVCHVDYKNSLPLQPLTITKRNPNLTISSSMQTRQTKNRVIKDVKPEKSNKTILPLKNMNSASYSSNCLKKNMNDTSKIPKKVKNVLKSSGLAVSKHVEKSFAPSNFEFMPPKGIPQQPCLKNGAAEILRKIKEKDSKTCLTNNGSIPLKKTLPSNSACIDSGMMFPPRELGTINEILEYNAEKNRSLKETSTLLDETSSSRNKINNEKIITDFENLQLETSEKKKQNKENLSPILKSTSEQTSSIENRRPLTRLQAKKNNIFMFSSMVTFSPNDEILSPPRSNTNTRKISLLYTPKTRKSIRQSIKGDLMTFSP